MIGTLWKTTCSIQPFDISVITLESLVQYYFCMQAHAWQNQVTFQRALCDKSQEDGKVLKELELKVAVRPADSTILVTFL